MGQFAGLFLCILLIYSIFVAFKIPKNATNEQEKVPSVRGGQNKEKWHTQGRAIVQMLGLPTSVSQWCSIAGNGDVGCLSKRQTDYPPIPNREIFRGNLYHHSSSLQIDP